MSACYLSLRCTSTAGWKSAQTMLNVRSVAPSSVSTWQYVSPWSTAGAVCVYVMFNCPPTASEGGRQKREAASESEQVQLISLGPLLLGQNNTEQEDNACLKQNTSACCSAQNYSSYLMEQQQYLNRMCSSLPPVFQVTVYTLSGISAALLLVLLLTAWSSFRRRQKPEAQQACDTQVDKEQQQ